jgi:DNA-binding transcriptional regulator YdaS (Cro superfamily)
MSSAKISSGLQYAIDAVGTKAELARRLHIKPQSLGRWRQIPAERIVQVEAITGVPREQLRPDLYRRGDKPGR